MVDQVKDVNELKEAIKSKRQEIIVSDHKLIRLIKVFKSVKNVAIVTSLLVSAGLLTAGILPIVLGAAAGAAASAAAGAAASAAAGAAASAAAGVAAAGAAAGVAAAGAAAGSVVAGLSGLGGAGLLALFTQYEVEYTYESEETQKQDGTPQKVLKQIFKLRIK